MAISLPESRWEKFKRSTAPHDLFSGLVTAGGSIAAAGRFFVIDAPRWGWFTLATAIAGLVVQGFKARSVLQQLDREDSRHPLQGCLHTLETVLLGAELEPARRVAAGLRLTVHVPDGKGQLVQAVAYVGDQRGGPGEGRVMPETVGIVGQAFREAQLNPLRLEVLADKRTGGDYDAFVAQMVTDYGFTLEGAKKLNPATMSWLAIAIPHDGKVEGILYCDSKEPEFFTDPRKEDILHATVGIAYFVGLRYS
jgi:hypothetical protein